ncbi:MAG: TonB-dependent receptor [Candidatus Kapaibacteriota bacterium]
MIQRFLGALFVVVVLMAGGTTGVSQTVSQSAVLRGSVVDRQTGEGLQGATIRIAATQQGAYTDGRGRFSISRVSGRQIRVLTSFLGYQSGDTTIVLPDSRDTAVVIIALTASGLNTEEIVVSAGRRVQAVQDVPISVATLSNRDLLERGVTQLDEALRYVSGVSVVGDQVNIRGASGFAFGVGSRTMVLLDGFPLMSGDNGDIKFDVLPLADVERVEIVKGAGSALYGTGALGGVVSLFTSAPSEELSVRGRVYGGGYTPLRHAAWQDYRQGSTPVEWGADLRLSQQLGTVGINLSGGIRSDESYRDFDRQLRGFGYGKLRWTPSDEHTVTVSTMLAQSNAENFVYWRDLSNATLPPLDQNLSERLWTSKLTAAIEWSAMLSPTTSLVVRPGLFRTRFENRIDGVTLDSNASTSIAYNTDVQLTTTLADRLTLTSGITGRLNVVESDLYGAQAQSIVSVFSQAEWQLPAAVILTVGVRLDREETVSLDPQLEFSPKLGISWEVDADVHVRASVGRGFRAATIAERYANIRYGPFQVRPNADIRPEYSWSAEAGVRYSPTSLGLPLDVDMAVFANELYDLIEPTFDLSDPRVPITFRNITRARILGAELSLRMALASWLGIETGVTAMLPRDLLLDEPLKYRNNVLWYSRGSWTFAVGRLPMELQAEYRFQNRVETIDDRLSVFIPNADQRVPSHVVDARLFARLEPLTGLPVRIGLIGRNLLDYYYAEVVANLSPTRSVLLQVEWL